MAWYDESVGHLAVQYAIDMSLCECLHCVHVIGVEIFVCYT